MAEKYTFPNFTPPPLDEKWGEGLSLGEKIQVMITRALQRVAAALALPFANLAVDIFDQANKIMRPGTERATSAMIDALIAGEGTPDWYRQALQSVKAESGESAWYLRLATYYAGIMAIMTGSLGPTRRWAEYSADIQFRSWLPDVSTLSALNRIGLVSEEGYLDAMKKLGVHDKLIPVMREFSRRLPGVNEAMMGKWRGVLSPANYDALLKRMGYNAEDITLYKELSVLIPPFNDLIRMMVRDAWNESAVSEYGYDEDYPAQINTWAEKQGYSPDWAKKYWRSHWQLPSPMQGYEMLHRGVISGPQLETLLKISDYPPFWRNALIKTSYNVLTRVDTRRLYQAGLIDEAKVQDTYQRMGYTPEDAGLLTEFAIRGASQDERDLTKSDIVGMFVDGLLDEAVLSDTLVNLGYDDTEAGRIIAQAKYDIAKAERTDNINFVKEKFLAGTIGEAEVTSQLSVIGLKSNSIDRYLLNWRRALAGQETIPSKADATGFYMDGIITLDEFKGVLKQLGYTDKSIGWYIASINLAMAEQSRPQGV